MTQRPTYHGDAELKRNFLTEIGKHEAADALLKGTYAKMNGHFRGCAIGCSVFSLNALQGKPQDMSNTDAYASHHRVAKDLGLPLWLAYMEDNLFERLPDDLSKTWPRRLAEAIPVGAVIDDTVLATIIVWSLTAERFGVIHATDDVEVKGWIATIADAITAESTGMITADQREGAARAARDAWAAWAARDAWAARAARAARDAWAAWAAWDAGAARAAWDAGDARAAWDAGDAWDARAADTRDAFYPALSEFVLKTLSELPAAESR